MADDILRQGVQGITDLITTPGQINLDFADVRAVMSEAGSAMMGIGAASGENRAAEAAKMAVSSPLMEESIEGATGMLLNFTGSEDLNLFEVNEAADIVVATADKGANIIFGTVIDPAMGDEVRVTVIATGFEGFETLARRPIQVRDRARRRGVSGLGDRERRELQVSDDDIDVPSFLRGSWPRSRRLACARVATAALEAHPSVRAARRRGRQAGPVRGLGDAGAVRGRARRAPRGALGLRRLRRLAHGRDRDLRARRPRRCCSGCSPTTSRSSRSAAPSTRCSAATTAASSTTCSPTGSPTTAT